MVYIENFKSMHTNAHPHGNASITQRCGNACVVWIFISLPLSLSLAEYRTHEWKQLTSRENFTIHFIWAFIHIETLAIHTRLFRVSLQAYVWNSHTNRSKLNDNINTNINNRFMDTSKWERQQQICFRRSYSQRVIFIINKLISK